MYAHSRNTRGERQGLLDHLRNVAELAGEFGAAFGAGKLLYRAGLWHDIGKADPEWQEYLERSEAGTWNSPKRIDHKAAGARLALDTGSWPAAFLIHAHHGGLQDRQEFKRWYAEKSKLPGVTRALAIFSGNWPPSSSPIEMPAGITSEFATETFLRLAYSALVDADTLDTERHNLAGDVGHRGSGVTLAELWARFEAYDGARDTHEGSAVNRVRTEVLAAAIAAAESPPGIFRLTVPTGGGKTRSGMAFALKHALNHGLRRVIVAVPFTTITTQTAAQYRDIFEARDADAGRVVLEHHSAAGEDDRDGDEGSQHELWQRAAAENWDAPIVVTTTVQLFESLFANRRNRMRKLHNITSSVLILDEAQSLPAGSLAPILDGLKQLSAHFGVTVVLSTATQPAFEAIVPFKDVVATEIVPGSERHFEELARVAYDWRINGPHSWAEVAVWLRAERSALAIVNTKRHATELLTALDGPEALHLSTLLCGAHRTDVLVEIRRRLEAGAPCRVVSTQVVEAGVNIDFPAVYRALAPLDSIIQAAGRCNREGRLERGRVVVFRPQDDAMPGGAYRTGADLTKVIAQDERFDPGQPSAIRRYSNLLFGSTEPDARKIQELRKGFDYPEVARRFRMINDDTEDVLVKYGTPEQRAEAEALAEGLRARTVNPRMALRRLRPFLVSIRKREADQWRGTWVEPVALAPGVSRWLGDYDSVQGLRAADAEYIE